MMNRGSPGGAFPSAVGQTILLIAMLLGQTTDSSGETISLEHLFTVQEAARDESLKRPATIAVDTLRGEIILSDRLRGEILIYDEEGRFLQRVGKSSGIRIPYHLTVGRGGIVIFGEQDLPVLGFIDRDATKMVNIELKPDHSQPFLPGGLTERSDGGIITVERFGTSIIQVDRESGSAEKFYLAAPSSSGEVEFQDVIMTPDGNVIALSSKGYAIHIIDRQGNLIKQFGVHGSKPENFSFPTAVALGPEETIWVVDSFQHALKVFRMDGSFVGEFGEMGTGEGKFFFPTDLAFGRANRLYVVEKGVPRFQAFRLTEPIGGGDR